MLVVVLRNYVLYQAMHRIWRPFAPLPMEKLLVSQKLSCELGEYSSPSPAARAVRQMQAAGKIVRPGQRVRFLYTRGRPGVRAWDVPDQPDPRTVDIARYHTLLQRAVQTVLAPIQQSVSGGVDSECLYLFPSSLPLQPSESASF